MLTVIPIPCTNVVHYNVNRSYRSWVSPTKNTFLDSNNENLCIMFSFYC